MIRAKAIALSAATILAVGGISIALLYANKYNGDQALKKLSLMYKFMKLIL